MSLGPLWLVPERLAVDFDEVLTTTRAMRRLDPDRPVADDQVHRLIEAATLGPSGGNAQPVRWIVVKDEAKRQQLGDIYKRASTGIFEPYRKLAKADPPDPIARSVLHLVDHFAEAPVVLAPCSRGRAVADERSFFAPPWDSPLLTTASSVWPCVQNVCLTARSLGLGTTPTVIHNILEAETRTVLGVPDDVVVWCLLPVGYPLGRWGRPKRRPVESVTYADEWGRPWQVDAEGDASQ